MSINVLKVEGMSCGHCVAAVENALKALAGINSVQVDLPGKKVTVDYNDGSIELAAIKEAIEDQGYDVVE